MIMCKLLRKPFFTVVRRLSSPLVKKSNSLVSAFDLSLILEISNNEASRIFLKKPQIVKNLNKDDLNNVVNSIKEMGIDKSLLAGEPSLLRFSPDLLKNRYNVFSECGVKPVTVSHLSLFLSILKKADIATLKSSGTVPSTVDIRYKLASHMTEWPSTLTNLIHVDENKQTLHTLRLKILQIFLEIFLEISEEDFFKSLETYPNIRYRPLANINETLYILQNIIKIPKPMIKSNLFLLEINPENLKALLSHVKHLGGKDIKNVIKQYPRIALQNYKLLIEKKRLFMKYGINDDAQSKYINVFTLSSKTLQNRIENTLKNPEYKPFLRHPRFLHLILSDKKSEMRLNKLLENDEKCYSLDVLARTPKHFEAFFNKPSNKRKNDKDLIYCLSECFGKYYNKKDILNAIKQHPYEKSIPLSQVQSVFDNLLSNKFDVHEIFQNCAIVLYPWDKISNEIDKLNKNDTNVIDTTLINNSQKLSLILYLIERNHYFTGSGVWPENGKSY